MPSKLPGHPPATDVTFTVVVSTGLATWSATDTFIKTSTPASLIVRATTAIPRANRRCNRLRVTMP